MAQNYKDTLNLPRTDFPMKANLVTREPELLKMWDETRLYQRIQQSRKDRELFVLHDGPPFANGDVHMGTALNKILKDFVVKSQTMLGKQAPYVPGWDCHGLPIEYKVVKESRDLSPLEVRKRCDAFARKYVDLQRAQFKRLGVLGDWEHPYLTLDRSEEHTSELQSHSDLVCRLLLEKKTRERPHPTRGAFRRDRPGRHNAGALRGRATSTSARAHNRPGARMRARCS